MKALSLMLAVIGLVLMAASPAISGEKFTAQGMFCRTAETATEFVKNWDGHNSVDAAKAINDAAGEPMCSPGTILLEEIERTTKLTTPTGTWQLVKLNIWGTTGNGMSVYLPKPVEAYTYVQVDEPEKLGQAI